MMQFRQDNTTRDRMVRNPLPFPGRFRDDVEPVDSIRFAGLALELADRRMQQLADALGCLGYFEDDGDGPRAA